MNALLDSEGKFRRDYPAYGATDLLDRLRAEDYERIDRLGHAYLDYTGGRRSRFGYLGTGTERMLYAHAAAPESRRVPPLHR